MGKSRLRAALSSSVNLKQCFPRAAYAHWCSGLDAFDWAATVDARKAIPAAQKLFVAENISAEPTRLALAKSVLFSHPSMPGADARVAGTPDT